MNDDIKKTADYGSENSRHRARYRQRHIDVVLNRQKAHPFAL